MPACVAAGIDLRSTGAEPLNNQPFLRADRISADLNVKPKARKQLEYLCECLEQADFLENESALEALAAFIRTRIEATGSRPTVILGKATRALPNLEQVLDDFVAGDSEGGKTGQACTAAILDMAFESVTTKRINDPSSKWPGDVGVFDGATGALVLSAEVKQRPFAESEILLFVKRLSHAGVHRALVAAFGQGATALDVQGLRDKADDLYAVELAVFTEPSALLREAMLFSDADLPVSLVRFPERMMARLTEMEASAERRQDWADLFSI